MRRALAAASAAGLYALVVRPRMLRLGTTPEEREARYPGDGLVPGGRRNGALATTIAAPPERVWPWLVQMGADRAGFYSWDRLDNGGRPSAERIHDEWQDVQEGGRVVSMPDGSHWFDVALLRPRRALVLRATLSVPGGRNLDPVQPLPRAYSDSTWAFYLSPTPEGHTRLVVTGESGGRPTALIALGNWLFWEPAHWVMQLRQFSQLRRRAEAPAPAPPAAAPAAATERPVHA